MIELYFLKILSDAISTTGFIKSEMTVSKEMWAGRNVNGSSCTVLWNAIWALSEEAEKATTDLSEAAWPTV